MNVKALPISTINRVPLDKASSSLFILLTLGLGFLRPTALTHFLPLFAFLGLILCWRYKALGFVLTLFSSSLLFLFSYGSIEQSERLWQIGFQAALSIAFAIAFLSSQEEEERVSLEKSLQEKTLDQVRHLNEEVDQQHDAWEKEKALLEADLEKWKEEARQRKIERQNDGQRIALLEQTFLQEKQTLLVELEETKKQVQQLQTFPEGAEKSPELVMRQYHQLKIQFEEKSKILNETRKNLFVAEEKLMAFQKEMEESAIDYDLSEIKKLQDEIEILVKENEELESEVSSLEGLISHILAK